LLIENKLIKLSFLVNLLVAPIVENSVLLSQLVSFLEQLEIN